MDDRDVVEYYCADERIARRFSSIVPRVGEFVVYDRVAYEVRYVTYALDENPHYCRANVELKLASDEMQRKVR